MYAATQQWNQTSQPARVFSEFGYQAKKTKKGGWDQARRVVAKAEHIDGKENPRFVVTSLMGEAWAAQALYEELYCARGDMENRIKEQFSLFADRVSTETMRANQMRLINHENCLLVITHGNIIYQSGSLLFWSEEDFRASP
jgi:hypothetical protein